MRAIVQEEYGPHRQVLHMREIPPPVAGPGQVLVRVRATSVHADVWHAVTGVPFVLRVMGSGLKAPKRRIPGTDLAGEVIQVGSGASRCSQASPKTCRSRRLRPSPPAPSSR